MRPDEAAIRVEGLTKRFGSLVALDGIDFEVPAGTVFGLLGPNGAGKTTAIRILTTILTPDGGRAEVLGHDVVREAEAVRYRIGLAGQFAAVDPNLTGSENLRLVGRLAQLPQPHRSGHGPTSSWSGSTWPTQPTAPSAPTRAACAGDWTWRPPWSSGRRCSSSTSRPPASTSRAATPCGRPSGSWWPSGTTVLLTTQYLEEADRLAERLAVVDGGQVIAEGTPAELKARLGSTVIEIAMGEEAAALRAQAAAGASGRRRTRSGKAARSGSPPTDGSRLLMDVLRSLDAEGLSPASLTVRDPSLDDVFLALTGHHAEPATDPAEEPAQIGAAR